MNHQIYDFFKKTSFNLRKVFKWIDSLSYAEWTDVLDVNSKAPVHCYLLNFAFKKVANCEQPVKIKPMNTSLYKFPTAMCLNHKWIYIYIYVCMCVCIYIYICVCIYIYIYSKNIIFVQKNFIKTQNTRNIIYSLEYFSILQLCV